MYSTDITYIDGVQTDGNSPEGDGIKCSGVRGEGNREVHTMDVILVRHGVPIGKERV